MTHGDGNGPGSPPGPNAKTGHPDRPPSYRQGDLARRRAQRDAAELIGGIRAVLFLLDCGDLRLDEAAATLHILSGRLAVIALTGELAA